MPQSSVSMPTSRWVTMQFLCGWTNSTGSSMVMMWPNEFSLRWSTIAASDVLFPEPVAPTKITRPRLATAMSFRMCGRFMLSIVGRTCGMVRITRPTLPCCTKALTRKRPIPCGATAKLHSFVLSNSAACLSFMIERVSASVCWPVSGWGETLVTLPSTLIAGGKSAVRNRSEPWRDTISRSRSLTNFDAWSRSMLNLSAREVLWELGLAACFRRSDDVTPHQVGEVLVERLHADAVAGLDRRIHLRDLALADQVADRRRAQHDLVRGDPAGTVLGLAQRLRDHADQRLRKHRPDHFLFRRREHVDDPVDRLGRARGMQRAEHQVAGFRGGQRQADRLEIAHFADQDRIRVLAQGRAQGVREAERMRTDLALVDQALLRFVHELDRIFDREHVAELVLVEMVDHRRERRRFARAGRAGAQDHAARLQRELGEDRRAIELLEGQDLRGNGPEHGAGAAVLVEGVDAKARQALDLEREVALERFFVVLALRVVHDVVHHVVHLLVLERVDIDAAHVAVNADHGRQAGRQVQVRGLVLDRERQQLGNVHDSSESGADSRRRRLRRR